MNTIMLVVIPIFFLFNSYLIGKLFQKTGKSITNLFSFSMGFIFLIFILSIISLPFYIFIDIVSVYPYALLATQLGLIFVYILNFKQLIFSFLFNWYKVFLFATTLMISLVFWSTLLYIKNQNSLIIIDNDSIFDYFHFSIFKLFNFTISDINKYFTISLPITLAFPLSAALCHSYEFIAKFSITKFLAYIFISSFFSILTFFNIQYIYSFFSFFIICLPIIYYLFFNKGFKKYSNSYYFYLNIFIFYLIFINWSFLLIACLFIVLYAISAYSKKQDLESGKVWQLFIYLIAIFGIFFLKINILISLIILFIFATTIIIYLFYKRNKKYYIHQFIVEKKVFNKLQWVIFIPIIILIGTIVILVSRNEYVFDYSFFLIDKTIITYANISIWTQYAFILFFSFVYFFYSFFNKNKNDSGFKFISNILILFWNPLSLSLLSQITYISNNQLVIENYWLWAIFFSIVLFFFYNKVIKFQFAYSIDNILIRNYFYKNTNTYKQLSYIMICCTLFFVLSSVMLLLIFK